MTVRETAEAIDAAAARWVARLDAGRDDPGLPVELDQWLAGDPRRRGALLRARAVWHLAGQELPEAAAHLAPDVARTGRRNVLGWAAAAAAIAAMGLGWTVFDEAASYSTEKGERRVAHLADGSTLLLNTETRSSVRMEEDRRAVALESGEAWFKVAKDRARPFVVAAGGVRVEAVGTAFAVRRLRGRAEVVVTEGRVRVWSARDPSRFVTLEAGHRATVSDAAAPRPSDVRVGAVSDALAWTTGEIVLNDMTLGQAAAEFNRYNRRQLSIEGALADEKLIGRFRVTEVDSFAESAAAMTGARIERRDDLIRVVE